MNRSRYLLVSFALTFAVFTAAANQTLEQDFAQPIHFEADNEFLDLRAGTFSASGNVRITQGSLIIEAARMDVEGFSSEGDEPEVFMVEGSPATYQQEVEPGLLAQAHASRIRYDATSRILTLEGNAQLRQGDNQVNAERITFNIEAQQVRAERGEDSDNQVRTTVQPRQRNNNDDEQNN